MSLIPHLIVSDADAAIALYQRAFGAEVLQKVPAPDGKHLMHVHLKVSGADLFLMDPMQGPASQPASFLLHLEVDDPAAWWKRAVDAGLEVKLPLAKQPWGATYGQLRDRFGVLWSISTISAPTRSS